MNEIKKFKLQEVLDLDTIDEDLETKALKIIENYWQAAYQKLRKRHRDWFIIDRFIDGDHWVIYNKVSNSIQSLPINSGEIRRSINLIDVQLRSTKNFITRNEMRIEVHPRVNSEESEEKRKELADKHQTLIQFYYDKFQLKQLQDELVDEGMRHGFSILMIYLKSLEPYPQIDVEVKSSYDFYCDPNATALDVNHCKYFLLTSKQYIDDIKENKDYNLLGNREISPESKENASEYKAQLDRSRDRMGLIIREGLEQINIKDIYFRFKGEDDKWKIGQITCSSNRILKAKTLNITDYSIAPYWPEKKVDQIFPKAWAMNLVPVNKAIDKMASHTETYVLKMLNGKILAREGAIVNKITDKQGEIIRWKGTMEPKEMNFAPLPSTPQAYMQTCRTYMEDLGGMHASSLGALPASSQSGKSIEALQAADANNVADPIKNLGYTLTIFAKRLIDLLSSNTAVESTVDYVKGTISKKVSFIGATPLKGNKETRSLYEKKNVLIVDPDVDLRIEMVPGLAYTEAGRYDKLLELVQAQALPVETLLEELRFSNVGDIVGKLQQQQRVKASLQNVGNPNQPNMNPIELADMENQSLLQGRQVPSTPPELAIPQHTQLHKAFIDEQTQKGIPQEQLNLLINHYNQETNKL